MTDTFKVNMMRCIFHFRLQRGGKNTLIDRAFFFFFFFFDIQMEKEILGFYVTALVCGCHYISSRDFFKKLLRHKSSKTMINHKEM